MHILFLTDNFPPEVNAPASRTFEHCREWVKAGCQVTVITCAPNFPKGVIYEGYRNRLWHSEDMAGIRVIRVWSYITANEGFVRRTLDYASFMIGAIVAAPFVPSVDIVIGTSPHLFTACGAFVVSRMKRIPYVFELRDLWPHSIKAVGALKEGPTLRFLERVELFLYRKAARIVSVTHSFRRNLAERGVEPAKIEVVTNGVDLSRFMPQPKDASLTARYGLEGKFVAGYVGTHGMAHALDTLLEAAKRLGAESADDRFRLLLLGDGAKKLDLVRKAQAMGLSNVIFIDSVAKDEVVRYWSLLDVAIIHLKRIDLFTTVIPSKIFEAMAMGIPLVHGVAGESAELVEREGVGIVFTPEDVGELCSAINRLERDPALYERLRAKCLAVAPHYDRSALALRMLASIEAAAGSVKVAALSRSRAG
jgi:hypothetical protein